VNIRNLKLSRVAWKNDAVVVFHFNITYYSQCLPPLGFPGFAWLHTHLSLNVRTVLLLPWPAVTKNVITLTAR
jgi:hypothetical protein